MKSNNHRHISLLEEARDKIMVSLSAHGLAILPPMDVMASARLIQQLGFQSQTTILDPWYNKGVGGERDDYNDYILSIIGALKKFSEHIFFWGFPQIVAPFVEKVPAPLKLQSWVTWYYKNSPSMIRGWRSAQMTCLHLSQPDAKMHVENFLNEAQLKRLKEGKLRFMPGPPSVIEEPLLCGFVGKKEQTGHPSQKPVAVIEKIILMGTAQGDLVVDLLSGSGTTAEAARKNQRLAIICDISEEYTQIAEKRLGVSRLSVDTNLLDQADNAVINLKALNLKSIFKNGKNSTHIDLPRAKQLKLAIQ
jgi:site-specific DNA-methyltransferase (adenine-specific)